MTWRQLIEENKTGRLSSARYVVVISATTLCLSTLALTAIVWWKLEVIPVLIAFGSSLALMAGGGYAVQKWAGTKETKE